MAHRRVGNYRHLFHASARLGTFAGALDIPWTHTTPYIGAFAGELDRYHELSVGSREPALGLMTRGDGKDFTFRVARFMETGGIQESDLRRLLVRARYFEHRNLFFKVEIGREGTREFSYYFRRRPGFDVIRAWLADRGVDDHDWARLVACAGALGKRTAHFLAASSIPARLAPGAAASSSTEKVYFSQPAGGDAWRRVNEAGRRWGLDGSAFDPLADHRDVLFERGGFVAFGFRAGAAAPGIKLDFRQLSPARVSALVAGRAGTGERFELLRTLFAKEQHDYASVRLGAGGLEATRVYCFAGRSARLETEPR